MNVPPYQLLFITSYPDFPDGTLFEPENTLYSHADLSKAANEKRQESAAWEYETKGCLLPGRGDGILSILSVETVFVCAPLSQALYRL